jgi:hypothetical protein
VNPPMNRRWVLAILIVLAPVAVRAQDERPATVVLEDGSTLIGRILEETASELRIRTASGLEVTVQRAAVVSIDRSGPVPKSAWPRDPSANRLLFAPTGRPLAKGEGSFSDHYVLFPGFNYGITDHLSLGAGVSVVPALSLSEQVYYVSPRLAWNLSDKASLSTGILYTYVGGEDDQFAVGFAIGTFGKPDASLSLGVGLLATREFDDTYPFDETGNYREPGRHWELQRAPIVMIGGNKRLSKHVNLISENWLVLGEDFDLSQQPFGLGLRFISERLTADVGLVFVADLLESGLPLPWLSFTYHFGGPDRSRKR